MPPSDFESNELIAMTEARHKLQVELDTWHRIAGEKIAALERERDALKREAEIERGIKRNAIEANIHARAEVERLTRERDGLEYGKCQLEQRNAGLLEDNERLRALLCPFGALDQPHNDDKPDDRELFAINKAIARTRQDAFAEGRLAALREMRGIVKGMRELATPREIVVAIDAMIKREEEGL